MKNIDIFTSGIVGLFLGVLMILGGGSSFAANTGVIIFCYGVMAIIYSGWNKLNGVKEI